MNVQILAFGIAKEIFATNLLDLEVMENVSCKDLKNLLETSYPRLRQLSSYMIAINNEYATDSQRIVAGDEIAIIPPVSGG
jgi:molybdopterin converting factor small subunit